MRAKSHSAKSSNRSQQATGKTGEVRIIGGKWKSRKLKVHNKEGLRPTTDRLKETLFNWLMLDIREASILDCFAGAGSLSFEAASRSAAKVVAIEKDKLAANQLQKNTQALNAQNVISILQGDFFTKAEGLNHNFDIIFIDPPFHQSMVEKTFQTLINNKLLKSGGLVYLEQESNSSFNLLQSSFAQHFELKKEKKSGQILAQLFVVTDLNN